MTQFKINEWMTPELNEEKYQMVRKHMKNVQCQSSGKCKLKPHDSIVPSPRRLKDKRVQTPHVTVDLVRVTNGRTTLKISIAIS